MSKVQESQISPFLEILDLPPELLAQSSSENLPPQTYLLANVIPLFPAAPENTNTNHQTSTKRKPEDDDLDPNSKKPKTYS